MYSSSFIYLCILTLQSVSIDAIFTELPWMNFNETIQKNYGVAVADVDHDGRFEWIVAGYTGPNLVLRYNSQTKQLENIAKANTPFEALMDPQGRAIGVGACDIDGDGKEEIYFLNTNNAYAGKSSYGDKLYKWRDGKYVDLFSDVVNKNLEFHKYSGRSVACVDRFGTGKYSVIISTYSFRGDGAFSLIEMDENHKNNNVSSGYIVLKDAASEAGIAMATGGRGVVVGPIIGNDGHSDIFFVNEGNYCARNKGDNFLFENLGNGTFRDIATEAGITDGNFNGRGVAMGDFNRDGLIDITYGNWVGPHRMYLQHRTPKDQIMFRNVAVMDYSERSRVRTVIAADFDNDGLSEIFFNNIYCCDRNRNTKQPNKVFKIIPQGEERDPLTEKLDIGDALEPYGNGTGGAVADVDSDGVLELLLSHGESGEGPLSLYKVLHAKYNHRIRIQPTTKNGAPARGALVKLDTTGAPQLQVIDGGSGYLCQMEPVAHFGLGMETATQLTIQWPDGKSITKTLTRSDIDKLHVVNHPDSVKVGNKSPNSSNLRVNSKIPDSQTMRTRFGSAFVSKLPNPRNMRVNSRFSYSQNMQKRFGSSVASKSPNSSNMRVTSKFRFGSTFGTKSPNSSNTQVNSKLSNSQNIPTRFGSAFGTKSAVIF